MDCPTCGKSLKTEQGMRQHHTKVHGDPLPNRTCKGCGSEFYDPKARQSYCEECNPNAGEHNGNWRDAQESAECVECGTEFEYYPSDKDGVYCAECVADASGLLPDNPAEGIEKSSIPCSYCGSILKRYPSAIDASSYGVFCDLDCYGSWLSANVVGESHHQWEGGTINYGSGWWQTRKKALQRDDFRCQNCGRTEDEIGRNPDVHHLKPVREFDNPSDAHTLANVISLCRRCHRLVEAGVANPPVTSLEK